MLACTKPVDPQHIGSKGALSHTAAIAVRKARLRQFCEFRLYYTILYYTILYYTILYYTILYYTILYYTILYYTILYYTILYYTILYYIILYCTILGQSDRGRARFCCCFRVPWPGAQNMKVRRLPGVALRQRHGSKPFVVLYKRLQALVAKQRGISML